MMQGRDLARKTTIELNLVKPSTCLQGFGAAWTCETSPFALVLSPDFKEHSGVACWTVRLIPDSISWYQRVARDSPMRVRVE